jgi:hypothetical protein
LTTLRAARAQVGTRRNKNAPRDIDLFIQSPKIASGDIEQLYRFCKSGFSFGDKTFVRENNLVATDLLASP